MEFLLLLVLVIFLAFALILSAQKRNRDKIEEFNKRIDEERRDIIAQGRLPNCNPAEIGYRPVLGEVLIAWIENVVKKEFRRDGHYTISSASLSFRLSKNVSLRTGGGKFIANKRWVPSARGRIIITDRALVFEGDIKSERITVSQITDVDIFVDGLLVKKRNGPTCCFYFEAPSPRFSAIAGIWKRQALK